MVGGRHRTWAARLAAAGRAGVLRLSTVRATAVRPAERCGTRSVVTGPRFTPIVAALPSIVPFVAPEEMERTREKPFKVRLGANEMTIGPSPKAVAAMQAAAADAWMYGVSVPTPARTPLENGPQLSFAPAD